MGNLKSNRRPCKQPMPQETRFSYKLRRLTSKLASPTPAQEDKVHKVVVYRNSLVTRADAESITSTSILEAVSSLEPTSSLTASLLPLSFAQNRRDIRERPEGFEMNGDPTPFAVRAQTLLPLDVAFARNDIRRRHEGFEGKVAHARSFSSLLSACGSSDYSDYCIYSPKRLSASLLPCISHPNVTTSCSTPSIYSQNDIEPCCVTTTERPAAFDDPHSLKSSVAGNSDESIYSDRAIGYDEAGLSSATSFDEESFIRIAETSLGW